MFRAQQNAFDDAVGELPKSASESSRQLLKVKIAKATDENLTSENWEYILVSCNRHMLGSARMLTMFRTFVTV